MWGALVWLLLLWIVPESSRCRHTSDETWWGAELQPCGCGFFFSVGLPSLLFPQISPDVCLLQGYRYFRIHNLSLNFIVSK